MLHINRSEETGDLILSNYDYSVNLVVFNEDIEGLREYLNRQGNLEELNAIRAMEVLNNE